MCMFFQKHMFSICKCFMCLEIWPALNKLGKFHVSGVWNCWLTRPFRGDFYFIFQPPFPAACGLGIIWVDFMVTSLTNDEWICPKFSNEANGKSHHLVASGFSEISQVGKTTPWNFIPILLMEENPANPLRSSWTSHDLQRQKHSGLCPPVSEPWISRVMISDGRLS